MKSFKVVKTPNGTIQDRDLDVSSFVYNSETIRNEIEARCQIVKGELNYNTNLGIPIGLDKESIDLSISETILNTYGVTNILSFSSKLVNKVYTANIIIKTIYNEDIGVTI